MQRIAKISCCSSRPLPHPDHCLDRSLLAQLIAPSRPIAWISSCCSSHLLHHPDPLLGFLVACSLLLSSSSIQPIAWVLDFSLFAHPLKPLAHRFLDSCSSLGHSRPLLGFIVAGLALPPFNPCLDLGLRVAMTARALSIALLGSPAIAWYLPSSCFIHRIAWISCCYDRLAIFEQVGAVQVDMAVGSQVLELERVGSPCRHK